jgi:hypothetical protein
LFAGKLNSKWEGSFIVKEVYSSGAVWLEGNKSTPEVQVLPGLSMDNVWRTT